MKIILDSGKEYELDVKEQTALGAMAAVYAACMAAMIGKDDGSIQKIIVVNEMVNHAETKRVAEIIGRSIGEHAAKGMGITYEELEAQTEAKIKEQKENPKKTDLEDMFKE